ncbi:copper resistance protein CopC [Peribacillus sp. NPDC096379]|uniref:copper resistance CopC family protein n=1 Tax=Peribacillus sp. NPDC096379 TaxID=3364393 RepID=UPI0038060C98
MKKLLFMLICMFISIPTMASAHTHLSSSNPTEGQVVTEELKEITLDYAENIEKLSTMKLLKDGVEIPLSQILVQDRQLVGTLSAPLENGSYIIDWNIVGEDGHPITGKVSFTVEIEQINKEKETTQPKVEENKQANEQQDKVETQTEDQTENQTENQTSTNTVTTIITVLLLAILVMGLVVLFKKKRK